VRKTRPIVIPINMTGTPQSESALVQDRRSNRFSVPVLGVEPTAYAALRSWSERELSRERVRLWYVATTRARDLLVLPRHSAKLPDNSWAKIADFGLESLPGVDSEIGEGRMTAVEAQENAQTRQTFAAEAARIATLKRTVVWQRPSRDEADKLQLCLPYLYSRILTMPKKPPKSQLLRLLAAPRED